MRRVYPFLLAALLVFSQLSFSWARGFDHQRIASEIFGIEVPVPRIVCLSQQKWQRMISEVNSVVQEISAGNDKRHFSEKNTIGLYLAGGMFEDDTIYIRYDFCGDERVLAHEAGHHLYHYLPLEQREIWIKRLCGRLYRTDDIVACCDKMGLLPYEKVNGSEIFSELYERFIFKEKLRR